MHTDLNISPTPLHLGVYTSRAKEIICYMAMHIADNSAAWGYKPKISRAFNRFEPTDLDAPDGEILFNIGLKSSYSWIESGRPSFWDRKTSPEKQKIWIAVHFKTQVLHWLKQANFTETAWARNSSLALFTLPEFGDITVAEVYCLYDHLLGRKSAMKKYQAGVVDALIGVKKDPILSEFEATRRQRVKDLKFQLNTEIDQLNAEIRKRVEEYRLQLEEEAEIRKVEIRQRLGKEIAEAELMTAPVF